MVLHVISVGGSLIVPSSIDTLFLKKFSQLIISRIKKGDRFILVAGGGKIARTYQEAANNIIEIDDEEKDWLGIHSTRLNAHLLRTIFKKHAHYKVIKDYEKDIEGLDFKEEILIGAGWKPGWSTDYVATLLAQKFNAKSILNLSNVDFVYDKDPNKYADAKKFEKISWAEFKILVGEKWDPGMSAPFDPIATKKSAELNLKVTIMSGKNLENLNSFFEGKEFSGTEIS